MPIKRFIYLLIILIFIGCASTQVQDKKSEDKINLNKNIIFTSKTLPKKENKKIKLSHDVVLKPIIHPIKPKNISDFSKPVSIAVKNVSLKDTLFALAKEVGINLVIDSDIEDKKIVANFNNVPFGIVLRAILSSQGLYYKINDNFVQVSKMLTKVFHIDYLMSVRTGSSNTQISLTSNSNGNTANTSSSASGTISIGTSEVVDFWKNIDSHLKSLLKDPMYEILKSEYDRATVKKDLSLIPYDENYEIEVKKQKLRMLSLKNELLKKELEEGNINAVQQYIQSSQSEETTTTTTTETTTTTTTGETENLVGTYTIDPQTGTIVVTTTPNIMKNVEKYIEKVKKEISRQVAIDVRILEVSLNSGHELGINWSQFPGTIQFYNMPFLKRNINTLLNQIGTSTTSSSSTSQNGIVSPLNNSPFSSSASGSLQVGVLNSLSPSASYQISNNALINFLSNFGKLKSIANPTLVTLNNQPAVVSVGINDFYVTYEQNTVAATQGLASNTVTTKVNPIFIGVTLNITPQISPDGEIILKIVPVINKKIGEKETPTGIASAPTQRIPIIETRQTSTVVKTKSGQTIVISGLIQEETSQQNSKVPIMGDIPLLGNLFKYKSKNRRKSELVIVLTPHLINQ